MPSLIQDLGILETAAGDVVAFAGGKIISDTIAGYDISVQVLPSGPVAPFVEFSGSFLSMLELGITEGAEFAAGVPISIAEKLNVTWYGVTISKPTGAAVAAAAVEYGKPA